MTRMCLPISKAFLVAILSFSFIFGLVGCNSSDATDGSGAAVTPSPTPTPSPNPTPLPTPTPSPSPAPLPTPTPFPSPAPTPAPTQTSCINTTAAQIVSVIGGPGGVANIYGQYGIDGAIAAASDFCTSFDSIATGYLLAIPTALVSCINIAATQIINATNKPNSGVANKYGQFGVDGAIIAANAFCSPIANAATNYSNTIQPALVSCINTAATQIAGAVNAPNTGAASTNGQFGVDGSIAAANIFCSSLTNISAGNYMMPAMMVSCINSSASQIASAVDASGGVASMYHQLGIDGSIFLASGFCTMPTSAMSNFSTTITSDQTACINKSATQIATAVNAPGAAANKYRQSGVDGAIETVWYGTCLPATSTPFANGTINLSAGKQITVNNGFGLPKVRTLLSGPASLSITGGPNGLIQILQVTAAEASEGPANENVTWINIPNLLPYSIPSPFSLIVTEPAGPMTISGSTTIVLLNTFQGTEYQGCTSPACTDIDGLPIFGCSASQQVTGTFNTMQRTLNASFLDNNGSSGSQEVIGTFAGTPFQYFQLVGNPTSAGACIPIGTVGVCTSDSDCPTGQCNMNGQCI